MTRILLILLAVALPLSAQVQVTVVNMIPQSLSNETERDAEPSIAVDPANPQRIAATAFTPDPLGSGTAPMFVSTDGGATWELRPLVPGANVTWDVSLRFGGLSGILYAGGIPEGGSPGTLVLRKPDFTSTAPPVILENPLRDQPWVEATTVLTGAAPDRIYVTAGDGFVHQSLDAATAPPPAGLTAINVSPPSGCTVRNGASVRSALHPTGRVYIAYLRFNDCSGDSPVGDVIVVRDDNWGASAAPYRALMTGTSQGVAAATAQTFPVYSGLGSQRIGMSVAIAVDPRNRDNVYVAWGEGSGAFNEYTLHVRRSTNGGLDWASSDLRTIPTATNPTLAVNAQGVVGFMYQKYVVATARWETHFETLPGMDLTLANVPDADGTGNSLGDYANLVAVGKNFYGVFSGNNFPDAANFPHNVTYLRNVNWTTQRLRNVANTANVPTSVDVFFFRIRMLPPEKDFYVRDWNDGVTGDDGSEPSTHPVFYQTGDVWNRRDSLPGAAGANDPPPNEDAGNGAGNIGDNWAFARIRRNAPSTSSTTVNTHFLVSEFGTGSAYSDNTTANPNLTFGPDATVMFNAADTGPITTPPMQWHLDPVMSPHLCLAVEIGTDDDPYAPPSLAGQWPGWSSGTDVRILADNNRAQRNMSLTTIPAGESGSMAEMFAVVHNGATFTRDMELAFDASGRAGVSMRIDGQPLLSKGTILLRDMKPGENRSLAVALQAGALEPDQQVEVHFAERFAGVPVNGFTVAARGASMASVIRERLELHRALFTRLAALGVAGAAGEADVVRNVKRFDAAEYVTLLRKRIARMDRMLPDARGFAVREAFDALAGSLKSGQPAGVAMAHSVLLARADAALTRARLDAGDPADVVQMVRWQRDLFRREEKLPCAAKLVAASDRYLQRIGKREITNAEYPALLAESADCLARRGAPREQLDALLTATTLASRQKAHRQVLLELDR